MYALTPQADTAAGLRALLVEYGDERHSTREKIARANAICHQFL